MMPQTPERPTTRGPLWDKSMQRLLSWLGKRIAVGSLTVETPKGALLRFSGTDKPELSAHWQLHDWQPLHRLFTGGSIGLAETYLEGRWSTPDLTALLEVAALNERHLGRPAEGLALSRLFQRLRHAWRDNSRRQAQRNIAAHYDLGNAFYALWLDPTMTYSSALFDEGTADLEQAQRRKYTRLAQVAGLESGAQTLEIGCGWGGFLEHAAQHYAVDIRGISISRAQCAYAQERLQRQALDTRARVEFCDYRDVNGRFDQVVSIEMFEAVGERYWGAYADTLKRVLAPDGTAALQIITIAEDRFEAYRHQPDFIQHYIFPGGMLPSNQALTALLERAGLEIRSRLHFGQDYARTLSAWRDRFDASWDAIKTLGFDERFKRLWHFYLGYCEAGFRQQTVDVVQLGVGHAT
jgi:cyclopropane-fatty-acyl-phospholipid synthase